MNGFWRKRLLASYQHYTWQQGSSSRLALFLDTFLVNGICLDADEHSGPEGAPIQIAEL
jgi:hypothetical protein